MSLHSWVPGAARPRRAGVAAVLALVLAVALAGLSSAQAAPVETVAAGSTTHVVDAVDTATSNLWVSAETGTSRVRITAGDTVEWQFDRATMAHDVSSIDSADDWQPRLQEYRDPQGAPVRYTFTTPGTYEFWCSIHGGTMRGTVVVEAAQPNAAPTASPLVDPRTGPAPLYTHFEARATDADGDGLAYLWDFGESDLAADTSTSSHAHHNYATPGRFTASLTVSDGKGGVFAQQYLIIATGGVKPIVTASASPTSGTAPLAVVFMGGASDEQGGDLTYAWDFGVPGTDADRASTARASWTYAQAGTYTAVLTVTDPQGNAGTGSVTVVVDGGTPGAPVLGVEATATPTGGTAPLTVQLATTVTNASTTSGRFAPFADGLATYPGLTGTATMVRGSDHTTTSIAVSGLKPGAAHMSHVHEQPCGVGNAGAHFRFDETQPYSEANEIWLMFTSGADGTSGDVVTDRDLRAGPKAVSVVVHDPDNPAKRIGCVDLAPSGLSYTWDFGDGQTGTGPGPEHTYPRAGTYTAVVSVVDEGAGHEGRRHGAPATDSVQIVVAGGPDTLAPQTTVLAGPSGSTRSRTASFRLASTESGGTFECSLDGAAYRTCGATATFARLRDGGYRLLVRAVDEAGNEDATPAVRTWRVDTRGPSVGATGPRATGDRTPTVRATVRDGGGPLARRQLTLRVDGKVREVRYDARTGRMTWTPSKPLPAGRHAVRLVAVDAAGNRTVTQWRLVLRR